MAVTATVLEWGGDEDTAIAALLHDAVEDQGGDAHGRADPRPASGSRVEPCSPTAPTAPRPTRPGKRPWQERKEHLPHALADADQPAALTTAADKLHNITATLRDVRANRPRDPDPLQRARRIVGDHRGGRGRPRPARRTRPGRGAAGGRRDVATRIRPDRARRDAVSGLTGRALAQDDGFGVPPGPCWQQRARAIGCSAHSGGGDRPDEQSLRRGGCPEAPRLWSPLAGATASSTRAYESRGCWRRY